ncbi:fatty acyl-AMP ligase [Plectonema cf. radiosum LEGE 06105]|uniref:Fatty acyl-AMP ligase n=1 Tax=Plectonema cf. radiosum LEGE 06105 TaxID=945769 RepID=A0A8J7JT55_9CYAN|nr:fatty acyl-AMP ligase [Plectonema radiosum]MBE9211735.1 fatty acyl-AMP ligase [Plectonema cf. radiosum LEGE 06105]
MENKIFKPDFLTLVDILRYRAIHQPEQTAYIFLQDGEKNLVSITYQKLSKRTQLIAQNLQSICPAGSNALLLYPPGLDFIEAFFACLYAGVVAIPAYPPRLNQSLSRLQAIIVDAQPTLVLTTQFLMSKLQQKFKEFEHLQTLDLLATNNINNDLVQEWQQPVINNDTLSFLQYTSGSTGKPKGVMVSHGNLLHNLECIKQAFELTSESVSVTWLPSFHDMGLIDGILEPLYTGYIGILMPPTSFLQQPIRWLQAISNYKATHSGSPNFGYDLCIRKITREQQQTLDLSTWHSAYNGSEPIKQETLENFTAKFQSNGFCAKYFYPCYGLAESTLIVSGGLINNEPIYCQINADSLENNQAVVTSKEVEKTRLLVGCGRGWLDTKILIVDPVSLKNCAPAQIGEILVSGSSVAQGYWNRPQETKEIFQAYLVDTGEGPFLRTGDLGFIKDGELYITGRLKDVIIIRGRNYYPQDIEFTAEQTHPALSFGCGAAFVADFKGQERLIIANEVERSYLKKLNITEIEGNIREAVAREHELQVYAVLLLKPASIPKTSSGKIQRHACRNKFLNGTLNLVNTQCQNN